MYVIYQYWCVVWCYLWVVVGIVVGDDVDLLFLGGVVQVVIVNCFVGMQVLYVDDFVVQCYDWFQFGVGDVLLLFGR